MGSCILHNSYSQNEIDTPKMSITATLNYMFEVSLILKAQ